MKNKKQRIFSLVMCALSAAIISVVSQIAIPTPFGIPITLQVFAVALCGFLLGTKYALASVLVYVGMGAIGLPVFYGFRGGVSAIFGDVTGGFIIGFIPLAVFCGLRKLLYWAKHGKALSLMLGVIGLLLCHIFGIAFYANLTGIDFLSSAAVTSLPFLIKDIILVALAFIITPKIVTAVSKSGYKL